MRITQGTFSFLPDLTDTEIRAQIDFALERGWAIGVEYTDDPHPRNCYWDMWNNPLFDLRDAAGAMSEILACREAHPHTYIRVNAFDSTRGFETTRLSFIVNRPADEPGFLLKRHEVSGRQIQYTLESYAAARAPAGRRYEQDST
jgi:ribulose-bisphosphate carboxylase small chain